MGRRTPSKEEGHCQLLCIDGLAGGFWGVGHSLHGEPCHHRHIMNDPFLVRDVGFLGEVEMPEIQAEARPRMTEYDERRVKYCPPSSQTQELALLG
jgi:hypothetical protein